MKELLLPERFGFLEEHQHEGHEFFFYDNHRVLTELLMPLDPQAHKGNFGHVLVVEGHVNYLGASRLSAYAALRVGAGLVSIYSPKKPIFHPRDVWEFIRNPKLSPDYLKKISSLVIGPGLSDHNGMQKLAKTVMLEALKRVAVMVVDADALPCFIGLSCKKSKTKVVCTPHPKEAAQLLKTTVHEIEKDRFMALKKLMTLPINRQVRIIWLLKGATTLIADENGQIFSLLGNTPLLASGGSGDVLSGAIAGLVPQTLSLFDATILAVNVTVLSARNHGVNADRGILASELAASFPSLLKRSA